MTGPASAPTWSRRSPMAATGSRRLRSVSRPSCSRRLLYLLEPSTGDEPARLNGFELAARLAFFLWDAPPDRELLEARPARSTRSQFTAQVDRMLLHRKPSSCSRASLRSGCTSLTSRRFSRTITTSRASTSRCVARCAKRPTCSYAGCFARIDRSPTRSRKRPPWSMRASKPTTASTKRGERSMRSRGGIEWTASRPAEAGCLPTAAS